MENQIIDLGDAMEIIQALMVKSLDHLMVSYANRFRVNPPTYSLQLYYKYLTYGCTLYSDINLRIIEQKSHGFSWR